MDFVLRRKTNRRPVSQARTALWCQGGRDAGSWSSPRALGYRCWYTWRVRLQSHCMPHPPAIQLTSCARSTPFCQVVTTMIDASCAAMECWISLAPGQLHRNDSEILCDLQKSLILNSSLRGTMHRTCGDHQRGCVGWDDSINTIVWAHVYAHITPMQLCGVGSRWVPSAEHYKTLEPSDRV